MYPREILNECTLNECDLVGMINNAYPIFVRGKPNYYFSYIIVFRTYIFHRKEIMIHRTICKTTDSFLAVFVVI